MYVKGELMTLIHVHWGLAYLKGRMRPGDLTTIARQNWLSTEAEECGAYIT